MVRKTAKGVTPNKRFIEARLPVVEAEGTLPDSGYQVKLVKPRMAIGLLMMDVRRSIPRPTPPRLVQTMIGGKQALVDNTSDPDYIAAIEEHENVVLLTYMEALIKLSMQNKPTEDELKEVHDIRNRLMGVVDFAGRNDYDLWLNYIVIQSDEDQTALFHLVNNLFEVDEKEVAETQETFPREVPRNTARTNNSAGNRD